MRTAQKAYCLLAIALIVIKPVTAQDDLGKGQEEFMSNCATCHGADGKGNGPLGAKLRTKPADLTTLAKRNNGVFSSDALYKMIDGREATRTHGGVEMPIWGCRHSSQPVSLENVRKRKHPNRPTSRRTVHASTFESLLDLPCEPESVIKDRILSIVEYLSHIQER